MRRYWNRMEDNIKKEGYGGVDSVHVVDNRSSDYSL
jgi:hypothetical protein